MGDSPRAKRLLAVAMLAGGIALAACGDDDGDEGGAATGAEESETTAEERGQPILIKTRVAFLAEPKGDVQTAGEVLSGSTLGDSAFCPGGTVSDRHGEPPLGLVVKTIRCPGGRLTITFSPTQDSLKQSGDWRVVNGGGRFDELSGGGEFKAVFESKGGEGRETFTGTVTR